MITAKDSGKALENMVQTTVDIISHGLGRTLDEMDLNFNVSINNKDYFSTKDIPEQDLKMFWFLEASYPFSIMEQCDIVASWNDGIKNCVPEEAWRKMLENCTYELCAFISETDAKKFQPWMLEQIKHIHEHGFFDNDIFEKAGLKPLDAMKELFNAFLDLDMAQRDKDEDGIISDLNASPEARENTVSLGLRFEQTDDGEVPVEYIVAHFDDMMNWKISLASENRTFRNLEINENLLLNQDKLYDTLFDAIKVLTKPEPEGPAPR